MKPMEKMKLKRMGGFLAALLVAVAVQAQVKPLHQLQQEVEDLRFGLFTHFGVPTYVEADWSDPDQAATIIDAPKLDCRQWAKAAKSAHMAYGCLSVKHHNGLCLWDSHTTDYTIMHSRFGRDIVKEYCEAFRKEGLKVVFHFSILDTHHRLRPHLITQKKIEMVKQQLEELLTNYGEVTAILFDGWDAPWSRSSYEEVSFPEIYKLVKSLQPNCLVIDMNSHKYPREELFYSDIKFYEQGAGQFIDAATNKLPAMACLPLQRTWFWKESMPTDTLRSAKQLVEEILIPYGKAHCSFVLNAAPNRDGLIDNNALQTLKEIGALCAKDVKNTYPVPVCEAPIVGRNLALGMPAEASWSYDICIMDFANDNDYKTAWYGMPEVKNPYWEVDLGRDCVADKVVLTEPAKNRVIQAYRIECKTMQGNWETIFEGETTTKNRVKIHTFPARMMAKVRVTITQYSGYPGIAELGVYQPL